MEPTLGELTNIRSDADLSTGDVGVVTDDGSSLVRQLNQTAQFQANQEREKYNTFLENINGIYKDVDAISSLDVAQEDRPALDKQMFEVLNGVFKNPKDFYQNAGSPVGQELHKKIAQFRMNAIQSKQDKLFDAAHREYMSRNPELLTDKNKNNVQGYLKAPLGKRQPFTLELPGLYDPAALGDQINKSIKQDYAHTGVSADGQFTYDEEGATYDPEAYRKRAEAMYYLPDSRGQQLRTTLEGRFNSMPKEIQKKYEKETDPVKAWYLDLQDQYRSPDQAKKSNIRANPFALESQKARTQFALEDLRNRNDTGREIKVAQVKAALEDQAKPAQTEFLLDLASDVLSNTTKPQVVSLGGGKYSNEQVVNASPVILKMFSKPIKTVSKDVLGTETTTDTVMQPDLLTKTPDGQLRTIFYQKKKDGSPMRGKDGNIIYESNEIIPLTEMMSVLGKDYMDKKSIPGAVNLAGDVLKQFGGDITKYRKARKGEETTETPSATDKGKKYTIGGKEFTEDQLQKGAAKYKMTLEAYKKSLGI